MTTDHAIESATATDADLIAAVRARDSSAYAVLFERHRQAANRLAASLSPGPDADDLVSEAFTRVYAQLVDGKGPDEAFRAYLLTAIRRLHVDRIRAGQRERPTQDDDLERPVAFVDTAELGFERTTTAEAFASLPERWQLVLWHLDVEGEKPAQVAALLGMTPNSVSALAYRAREGLRQAYLQCHLTPATDKTCADVTGKLGAHVRGGLSSRQAAKVDDHLSGCRRCMGLYLELEEFNSGLGALLGPAVLGTAAMGYLGAHALLGVGAGLGATGAGAAGGGAGGAGGGGASSGAVAAGAAGAAGLVVAAAVTAVATGLMPLHGSHTAATPQHSQVTAAPSSPAATNKPTSPKPSTKATTSPASTAPSATATPSVSPAPTASATPSPAPTTSAPTTSTPTSAAPPAYDSSIQGVNFTNLATPLSRRMAVTLDVTGASGTSRTVTATFSFTTEVTVSSTSGWSSCPTSADPVTTLTCTLTAKKDGQHSPSVDLTGVYPSGTVSLTSADDSDATDNQLDFTAGPWTAP